MKISVAKKMNGKNRLYTVLISLFGFLIVCCGGRASFDTNLSAQNKLIFHTGYVDSLLLWMQKGCDKNDIDILALQPTAQLMEQLLKRNEKGNIPTFRETLQEFNYKDSLSGEIYLLNTAYQKQAEIASLINKIRETDFSENVYNRVLKYFPDGYTPPRDYDVFFTSTGWQWGDAMMFSYVVEEGEYLLSSGGTPAIMFNLSLVCGLYGNTTAERMDVMENVMSHELFHAIFYDYTDCNWLFRKDDINNELLYVMLNEGVAHYIADGELLRSGYEQDDDLKQRERLVFASLSDSVKIIFNTENDEEIRRSAINSGTYGRYWTKYTAITGMFMCYHIEQYYGLEGIRESIKNGSVYFARKYDSLRKINTNLPKLPSEIMEFTGKN
jgi:hypothetical protein